MHYKRILTIQDISCVGQCSLTVALPVLSACGQETCVLPTALLSTHTGGFGKPVIVPLADRLPGIAAHWQENGIAFDAIVTGYLGSVSAIHTAMVLMDTMLAPGGRRIVDPAMADHGRLYSGFDEAYVREMKGLCEKADILLPNLTEAAMLAGLPVPESPSLAEAEKLAEALTCPTVLLTGVGETASGFLLKENGILRQYSHRRLPGSFSGTGDLFAAAFTGGLMAGKTTYDSARIAADFTCRCIESTIENPAHWYGVRFEPVLPELVRMINS